MVNLKITKDGVSKRIIFFLLILFTLMPNILNFKIGPMVLKPLYLFLLILTGMLFIKKRVCIPYMPITFFILYAVIISIVSMIWFGIDRTFFNYIVGFVILVIFISLGRNISYDEWIKILCMVWVSLFVAIIINDLLQKDHFMFYFANLSWMEHPYHNTVVVGGANLEATWVALLSAVFIDNRKKWIVFFLSLALSLCYSSRAAIICNFIVLFFFISNNNKSRDMKKLYIVISTIAMLTALVVIYQMGYFDRILSRFLETGTESGSLGRLEMWINIPNAIATYPFGVGLGNAMKGIEAVSGRSFYESNLHFLAAQMFLDTGIIGGIAYLCLWTKFLIIEIKSKFNVKISLLLLLYFILSFIQFSGGETFFFCILGIYLNQRIYQTRITAQIKIYNKG